MKRIAFIGECMIELNGSPFGEMIQTFGGDVLNSALYLSRALSCQQSNQLEVFFISAIGDDPISKGMRERWQQEQINCQWVLEDKNIIQAFILYKLTAMASVLSFIGAIILQLAIYFNILISFTGKCIR